MESPRSHRKLHRTNSSDKLQNFVFVRNDWQMRRVWLVWGFASGGISTLGAFGDKDKAANWLVNNEKSIHFEENLKATMGFTRMV